MTVQEAIHAFIEFYLFTRVPFKTVEWECLKITHEIEGEDPRLDWVSSFRKALVALKKHQKEIPQFSSQDLVDRAREKGYLAAILMSPEDCLLLIAGERLKIEDPLLSVILERPEEHLRFKREKLIQELGEQGQPFDPLQQIHATQFISTHRKATLYQRFRTLPFILRFSIETAVILLTLISLMWIIPEIRNTYENAVQKRINDYLIESSLTDSPPPDGTSKDPKPVATPAEGAATEPSAEKEALSDTPAAPRKQPKVNEGETWRFSFTGAQTNELENGILDAIRKQGTDATKPITVPGGIQFDFTMDVDRLVPLKTTLEEMVQRLKIRADAGRGANMSWYKKKNMRTRKISAGQVQVVIWISTL